MAKVGAPILRETDEDELVGFGSKGEEVLVITLETLR